MILKEASDTKRSMKLIAVHDKKTGLYDNPFTVRHVGEAVREWDIVRKDPQTKFGKNPEDFDLFQIGEYDDELGQLIPQKHIHLASGV